VLGEIELLAGVRGERESDKAVQACNDYLRMGPGRSLEKLLGVYRGQTGAKPGPENPPTTRRNTLKEWSADYTWQARAATFDAAADERKTAEQEERRREVMASGLAQDYERVEALKELAGFLGEQIREEVEGATGQARYPNVWLRDVKNVSGVIPGVDEEEDGIIWKREIIYRFNASLIDQFRGALDDIAKETGGRKQKADLLLQYIDMSKLTEEQLDRIAAGEDPVRVLFGSQ
jgi:hypothetical protein